MGASISLTANATGIDCDDSETHCTRYRPAELETLCESTHFTRKEMQILYRGFKQESPSGMVTEETFKQIYAQFFPQGDSNAYAHFVFRAFDQDNSGTLSFEEFVTGLSVLLRGSPDDKLRWTFSLYDANGDGLVSKADMMEVVSAIYALMGRFAEPCIGEDTAKQHVDRVFERMDREGKGVLTLDEFIEKCQKDDVISKSLTVFDTLI